ncbi:hypothetical protein GWG54_15225 [Natronococcus sp. JC468]|uniref:hypothetical protein n=1 Tax=Natronococcus sp. JC468 TaxID=1961921 RepID=UPI00143ADD96|nr:hypothetical protein [Natronococcus sp. JC468]NKE37149.1 hypothetical protein [Natronococcus sp. JC468]
MLDLFDFNVVRQMLRCVQNFCRPLDAEFASLNVFATTVASVGSLFVLITLLG